MISSPLGSPTLTEHPRETEDSTGQGPAGARRTDGPRRGLAALRFAARHRMLSPEYGRILGRFLWRRLLTRAGHRWRTDGMVFLGPKLQLQIGRNGQIRFGRFAWIGAGTKIRCHEGSVEIGAKTVLGQECTISAYQRVRIGEQCVIADRAMFIDFDHVVDNPELPIRLQGIYKRDVVVGSNVWIGYGAQILRGVTVGDNAIIGASSVVTRDIPANAVAAGTPARVVRMRPLPERLTWPDPVEPDQYGPSGPR
jgi:acetyltransferase-like isoleucine patch superfamily enzyme